MRRSEGRRGRAVRGGREGRQGLGRPRDSGQGTEISNLDCAEREGTSLVLAQVATALRLKQDGELVLKMSGSTLVTRQVFELLRGSSPGAVQARD